MLLGAIHEPQYLQDCDSFLYYSLSKSSCVLLWSIITVSFRSFPFFLFCVGFIFGVIFICHILVFINSSILWAKWFRQWRLVRDAVSDTLQSGGPLHPMSSGRESLWLFTGSQFPVSVRSRSRRPSSPSQRDPTGVGVVTDGRGPEARPIRSPQEVNEKKVKTLSSHPFFLRG